MTDKPEETTTQPVQPTQPGMTGVRKRQQIQNTNKNIFVWLAVASVIVSICLVALQFLVREFMFNQKIISKKGDTNKILIQNVKEAKVLQDNVNALLADSNLSALKYETENTQTSALSVVLDALPVEGDATEFANSLQAAVLPRSGVSIRELNTTTIEDPNAMTTDVVATAATQAMSLPFSAGFSGKYADVQQALVDMSRVIRPIHLTNLTIRADDNGVLQTNISGVTYYLPARAVEVREEVLKP